MPLAPHVRPEAFIFLTSEEQAFSDEMRSYWTSFARTGDPNDRQAVVWPTFAPEPDAEAITVTAGMGLIGARSGPAAPPGSRLWR